MGQIDHIPLFGDVTYMSHWAIMVKKSKKFLKLKFALKPIY